MDPIALVAQAAQPASEAKPTSTGMDGKTGGVFQILMSREISLISDTIKGLSTKKAMVGDPMMLWMMSALMQVNQAAGPEQAQSAQPDVLPQVVEGSRPLEQPKAKAAIPIQMDAAAALFQWMSANPEQFKSLIIDQKAGEIDIARLPEAINAAMQGGDPQFIAQAGWQAEDIRTFLQSVVTGDVPPATDANGTNVVEVDGNGGALKQIRELFEQVLIAQTADTEQSAVKVTPSVWMRDNNAEAGPPAAKPVGLPLTAMQPKTQLVAATDAAKADGSQGSAEANDDGGMQTAGDDETVAFHAAMRSYHITARAPSQSQDSLPAGAVATMTKPGTEAFDAIVQGISGLKDASAKEIQIELKPEFLGKVTIHLAMEEGGLVAKIAAANPRVQDSFLNQVNSLQSVLADQGLKDVRVIVTSSSVQDLNLQQQADRRSQNQQQQQKRNRFAVQGVETTTTPAVQAYEAFYNTSAINYLA